mmetsp:Transcript_16437/g.19738  ORF Transcript_16437/g.19738 Transcript_16437/m.19738 type:complete len:114 (-) Transcript_16437:256-597(-)|eukprot:jgi/Bigna1/59822/fgenesh1_kg.7_\
MSVPDSNKKGGEKKAFQPYGFLYDVRRIPCMRQTLLNATGTGIALGLHSFYRHRVPATAMFTGMKTAMLVSAISWATCRINFRNRRRKIYDIMENQEKYSKKFGKKNPESESR